MHTHTHTRPHTRITHLHRLTSIPHKHIHSCANTTIQRLGSARRQTDTHMQPMCACKSTCSPTPGSFMWLQLCARCHWQPLTQQREEEIWKLTDFSERYATMEKRTNTSTRNWCPFLKRLRRFHFF